MADPADCSKLQPKSSSQPFEETNLREKKLQKQNYNRKHHHILRRNIIQNNCNPNHHHTHLTNYFIEQIATQINHHHNNFYDKKLKHLQPKSSSQ